MYYPNHQMYQQNYPQMMQMQRGHTCSHVPATPSQMMQPSPMMQQQQQPYQQPQQQSYPGSMVGCQNVCTSPLTPHPAPPLPRIPQHQLQQQQQQQHQLLQHQQNSQQQPYYVQSSMAMNQGNNETNLRVYQIDNPMPEHLMPPLQPAVQPYLIVNGQAQPMVGPPPELLWSELSK